MPATNKVCKFWLDLQNDFDLKEEKNVKGDKVQQNHYRKI